MSWNNIDDKHKKKYDRGFVSCEEHYEKVYIIDTILEHLPDYTREQVEKAVEHCCKTIGAPRPRKQFLQCVAQQLGSSY
jgi:hypothetical protein